MRYHYEPFRLNLGCIHTNFARSWCIRKTAWEGAAITSRSIAVVKVLVETNKRTYRIGNNFFWRRKLNVCKLTTVTIWKVFAENEAQKNNVRPERRSWCCLGSKAPVENSEYVQTHKPYFVSMWNYNNQ